METTPRSKSQGLWISDKFKIINKTADGFFNYGPLVSTADRYANEVFAVFILGFYAAINWIDFKTFRHPPKWPPSIGTFM